MKPVKEPPPPIALLQRPLSVIVANQLCNYCFKPPAPGKELSRCSACKRCAYCSKECQQKDWLLGKTHKVICKDYQMANAQTRLVAENAAGGMNRQVRMDSFAARRRLPFQHPYVCHGIHFELKCTVCLRTPWETETYFPMKYTCERCSGAWWCSDECYSTRPLLHSAKECAFFEYYIGCEHAQIAHALSTASIDRFTVVSSAPRTEYIPTTAVDGWDDFERVVPGFSDTVKTVAAKFAHLYHTIGLGFDALAKEAASLPMTLLATLEELFADLPTRKALKIHLIGAGDREGAVRSGLEEMLHFLPALQRLDIVFVGPRIQLYALNARWRPDPTANVACDACKALGRIRTEGADGRLYHETSVASAGDVDLYVMINSGFSECEMETWKPTVDLMLKKRKPLLMTQFTMQEARRELEYLEKEWRGRYEIVKPSAPNRWHGVVPAGGKYQVYNPSSQELLHGRASFWHCVVRGK